MHDLKSKGAITEEEYCARRSAIIDETPPPEGERGGIFRWSLLGCLGMLAIVGTLLTVLIVIIVVAPGTGSDLTQLEDIRVAFIQGSSGKVKTEAGMEYRVTIDKITEPAISDDPFENPAPRHHYITIAVTIENVGEHETIGGDFKLRTRDGSEHRRSVLGGIGATDLSALTGLTPGGRTTAVLAFQVRDGSVVDWLQFDPDPFAAKGDLYFDNE